MHNFFLCNYGVLASVPICTRQAKCLVCGMCLKMYWRTVHQCNWLIIQTSAYQTYRSINLSGAPLEISMHTSLHPGTVSQPLILAVVVCHCSVYPYYLRSMMTSSNGNIFRVTGPSCGEFTGHRWIPRTKASNAELWCFLWYAPE